MHVADGEDMNQQTDERNEADIDTAQPVHRQAEIGAKLPDLNPRPKVIHRDDGCPARPQHCGRLKTTNIESNKKGHYHGDAYRGTSHNPDERLAADAST